MSAYYCAQLTDVYTLNPKPWRNRPGIKFLHLGLLEVELRIVNPGQLSTNIEIRIGFPLKGSIGFL